MNKLPSVIHFLVFLWLVFPTILCAQTFSESTRFKHLSVSDGLSDNYVGAILQDREGFMWIGTSDGLNKYNGYKFTIYRHNPIDTNSIGPGSISCIFEDKEGLLWIGTSGSLSVLNKRTNKIRVYKNNTNDSCSLSNDQVTDIIEDKEGNIWVSTYGGGLNKFDKKTGKFKVYRNNPNNLNSISSDNVQNCFEDANGILWIATFGGNKGGLNSFDKKSEKFTFYAAEGIGNLVWKVYEDSDGKIWIGNNIGSLCEFDKKEKKVINQFVHNPKDKNSISDNRATWFCEDNKGYLWIGTFNGLNVLDKKTGKFVAFKNDPNNSTSISNNVISKVYKDNQGLVWICTSGGGINIYDENNNQFVVFKNNPKKENSLTNNLVYSIYEDSKGVIWMGTKSGGLTAFNKELKEFKFYKGEILFNDKKIGIPPLSQIQELDGELYLAPPSVNLLQFNRSKQTYSYLEPPFYGTENTPGFIFNILADSKKTLWVGNPYFLYNIDFRNKKITTFKHNPKDSTSISENFTHSFFEDSESNIWVSTSNSGVNVFERRSGKFFCFKNEPNNTNSISNNVVNAMYEAPNGVFWLGTNGGGLNALVLQGGKDKYTKEYKFYRFTEEDGLPNNLITGILPDNEGNLWIATNNGLCKFTPPTYLSLSVKEYLNKVLSDIKNDEVKNDVPIFKNYDKSDGLPHNSFSGATYKSKDGEMYLGTFDGLLSFYPNTIKDNSHKPPVYFTAFKIFEKEFALDTPITSKKQITLSYQQSFFSFEFVALDYAEPSKNKYAYMMEGFDSTWIHIGNRQYASYTNLDPGEYIFRVKASNNNGVWNEEGAHVHIIITPPFWKTKLFYVLCVLVLIIVAYLYIKWRERKLIEEKKALENEVEKRTKEVVKEKEKVEQAHFEIIQKNKKIEAAYAIIEDKNQQITDSINYAKRIQQAILPVNEDVYSTFTNCFILYKPKDIVSGDFYFFERNKQQSIKNTENIVFIAAADCTGHGVPGAFMSMIGSEKLTDAVQQSKVPGEILTLINKGIKTTLRQSENDSETHDGMDIAFCTLDLSNNKLLYAGANRPLLIIRNGSTDIEEIKPTKSAIGGFTDNNQYFETHEIQLQTGDTFYMYTDGYADQFGGEKEKKFTTKQFKQLLLTIQNKTMQEQCDELNTTINKWSEHVEQVDDILVIGIRIQ